MDKNNTKIKFNIMAIILIIIFCCAISPKTLQNDTFYTIKIGEYILQNGLTMIDPFSWHENLSYTFPHWAYDVAIYAIYNLGGHLGIYISTMVLSSILGVISYLTCKKLNKNSVLSFVFTIAAMYMLKDYIAARAQLVTFILFILTINFIESFLETKKKRYAIGLIIIPILIANLHVAVFPFYFILYLPYIAEYIISLISVKEIIKRKLKKYNLLLNKSEGEEAETLKEKIKKLEERRAREDKKEPYKVIITHNDNTKFLIIIMIICLFTGFCTPLGTVPYTYLYKTMMGNSVDNISEHLPLVLINNFELMVAIVILVMVLMFTDTKIRLCDLFMLAGLLYLAFMSRRQVSILVLICLPILVRLICSFVNKYGKEDIKKLEKYMTRILGAITVTGLVLILSLLSYKDKLNDQYVSESSYPVEASEWILNNLDVDNIRLYNEYNFGSYLIFKGIPVFIDSRCDLYLPEFNENVNIFNDFLTISNLNSQNIQSKIDKYEFTHFITYKTSKLNLYLKSNTDKYNQIYIDDYFVIYEKI